MTAYEMMLSESQERMLMVLHHEREAAARAISRNGTSTSPSSAKPLKKIGSWSATMAS